jgi:hypothetical protein
MLGEMDRQQALGPLLRSMAGTARRDETRRRGLDEAGHAKAWIEELSAPELKAGDSRRIVSCFLHQGQIRERAIRDCCPFFLNPVMTGPDKRCGLMAYWCCSAVLSATERSRRRRNNSRLSPGIAARLPTWISPAKDAAPTEHLGRARHNVPLLPNTQFAPLTLSVGSLTQLLQTTIRAKNA